MTRKEELELIANEIIGYSDGAYDIAWGEEYKALTLEERQIVEDYVFEVIGTCDSCGWNFTLDSMELHSDGQCYCWRCYEDKIEEDEEESEE